MNTKKHAIIALAIGIAASSLLTAPTVAGALELWATGPNSRFDGVTGAYVGPLRIGGPGLSERGMAIGPDGALYVCGETQGIQGAVQRYDANTHQYIDTFVESHAGGLTGPSGLAFGADGNLYVTSSTQDSIYRFDGQSGEFMDIFASEGMDTPRSVLFGPDGNLYVASQGGDCVVRYDALTGDLIDIFATDANLRGPGRPSVRAPTGTSTSARRSLRAHPGPARSSASTARPGILWGSSSNPGTTDRSTPSV